MKSNYKPSVVALLAEKVLEEHKDCRSESRFVDIDRILKKEGISVVETELSDEVIYHTYFRPDDKDGHIVIEINKNLILETRRFAEAAAYGHYLYNFADGESYDYTRSLTVGGETLSKLAYPTRFLDNVDESFAAFLLVPREDLSTCESTFSRMHNLSLGQQIPFASAQFVVDIDVMEDLYVFYGFCDAETLLKSNREETKRSNKLFFDILAESLGLDTKNERLMMIFRSAFKDALDSVGPVIEENDEKEGTEK